jgi:glycosyltransferase involved in cell wall biosynthesis
MNALTVVVLVAAAIPAALFFANLRRYRRPAPPTASAQLPAVSVLIPARNEERSIGAAVASVLANRGVDLEVVVLDDHSTDATADIVRQMAESDERVRLERAPRLPSGWCGKQHACAALAERASHDRLVFLDADVRLSRDALATMVAFQESSGADLVSGVPRQETGSFAERLVIPLIHFVLLAFLPLGRMRQSTHPSYAAGCGQLFLARRAPYEAAGGHRSIRSSRHDGVKLPRAFRTAGFRTDLFDATELAVCRMYRSFEEVWSGFAKNADEGLATPRLILPMTAFLALGQIAPFVLLPLAAGAPGPVKGALVVAALLAWAPRLAAAVRFRQSFVGALLHPVGMLVMLAIQWYAFIGKAVGRPASWKGRSYPAAAAVVLALCVAPGAQALERPELPELTAKELDRIAGGKLVVRKARGDDPDTVKGSVTGVVEIGAAVDEVWKAVLDFEGLPERNKSLRETERYVDQIDETGQRTIKVRYSLQVFMERVGYHLHHEFDPATGVLRWSLDPSRSNDVARIDGTMSVWPGSKDATTLLLFTSRADTGRPIPDWVERYLTETTLRGYLRSIKQHSEVLGAAT